MEYLESMTELLDFEDSINDTNDKYYIEETLRSMEQTEKNDDKPSSLSSGHKSKKKPKADKNKLDIIIDEQQNTSRVSTSKKNGDGDIEMITIIPSISDEIRSMLKRSEDKKAAELLGAIDEFKEKFQELHISNSLNIPIKDVFPGKKINMEIKDIMVYFMYDETIFGLISSFLYERSFTDDDIYKLKKLVTFNYL